MLFWHSRWNEMKQLHRTERYKNEQVSPMSVIFMVECENVEA
jgi:hypothetical protein